MEDADIDPYKILELDSTLEDLGDADVLKVSPCATVGEHACVLAEGKALPAPLLDMPGSCSYTSQL